jgi:hypothetical protein
VPWRKNFGLFRRPDGGRWDGDIVGGSLRDPQTERATPPTKLSGRGAAETAPRLALCRGLALCRCGSTAPVRSRSDRTTMAPLMRRSPLPTLAPRAAGA